MRGMPHRSSVALRYHRLGRQDRALPMRHTGAPTRRDQIRSVTWGSIYLPAPKPQFAASVIAVVASYGVVAC